MEQSLKLKLLRKLLPKQGEEGFSLIELVVVVSVLAVLSAIALPTFMCTTREAKATTALAALKQIQTECTVKKTNTEDIASTFTTSNLQGYEIESEGSNSCNGASGTGLIRAIPNEPDQLPTFILATNTNELTYSFRGETGTNFTDCLDLICGLSSSTNSLSEGIEYGVMLPDNPYAIEFDDNHTTCGIGGEIKPWQNWGSNQDIPWGWNHVGQPVISPEHGTIEERHGLCTWLMKGYEYTVPLESEYHSVCGVNQYGAYECNPKPGKRFLDPW